MLWLQTYFTETWVDRDEANIDVKLFYDLPAALRAKVAQSITMDILDRVHVLRDMDVGLQQMLAQHMRPSEVLPGILRALQYVCVNPQSTRLNLRKPQRCSWLVDMTHVAISMVPYAYEMYVHDTTRGPHLVESTNSTCALLLCRP